MVIHPMRRYYNCNKLSAVLLRPLVVMLAFIALGCTRQSQISLPEDGIPVLKENALLTTPVGGLERTTSQTEVVPVKGQPFSQALQVTIGDKSTETNSTQLTLVTTEQVEKGDALLASFWARGISATAQQAAQMEFLFEQSSEPWTKSITHHVVTAEDGTTWKQVVVPFTSADRYAPGRAMVALRFAFGPQTIEVGGLNVVNYGKRHTTDELIAFVAGQNPLGKVNVGLHRNQTKQTMRGFGGNFAQPRYGALEPMDPVGLYNLDNLQVVHARVGIPLNYWNPAPGVYKDEAQAQAALLQMQMLAQRGLPIAASVWEGPAWMLGGKPETPRTLPREHYAKCAEAVAQFLLKARDKYGVTVEYLSFNEPDHGVNFKFTPAQMIEFIRLAGPRFAALGLKTKFLVGDTSTGASFVAYARPLLEDKTIAPYLGPLAFHSWDVLSVRESEYSAIAALAQEFDKPVWCMEAGHNSQLWQTPNPWPSWENALRTALAYEKTLRLTGAELMDYWTYQNNYPLVNQEGKTPLPVWQVLRQMQDVFGAGSRVIATKSDNDQLAITATSGPGQDQFAVLLVNSTGAGEVRLSGLPPGARVRIIESTRAAQRREVPGVLRTDNRGQITIAMPARSVVTLLSRRNADVDKIRTES